MGVDRMRGNELLSRSGEGGGVGRESDSDITRQLNDGEKLRAVKLNKFVNKRSEDKIIY